MYQKKREEEATVTEETMRRRKDNTVSLKKKVDNSHDFFLFPSRFADFIGKKRKEFSSYGKKNRKKTFLSPHFFNPKKLPGLPPLRRGTR